MPRVYILILNYRNWQDTLECLESVFRLQYPNFHAIVIDNDSGNDSLQRLMEWAETSQRTNTGQLPVEPSGYQYFHSRDLEATADPVSFSRLVFIQNEKNSGFAAGNNIVLKLLTGEDAYVWLLNPDMVVQEDTLTQLVNFTTEQPARSIVGAVIKFYEQPGKIHFYGGCRIRFHSATVMPVTAPDQVSRLDYISGGSLFTKAASFREIGLLPEEYFLYWEETDWCYRARQAGYQLAVCPTAICFDKVGTSIGRGFAAEYYYTRNGLLFVSRYQAGKIPFVVFFSLLRLLKRTLSGRWDRVRGIREGILAYLKRDSHEAK
jgi:GT2 family glycosyltransferase